MLTKVLSIDDLLSQAINTKELYNQRGILNVVHSRLSVLGGSQENWNRYNAIAERVKENMIKAGFKYA